MIRIGIEMGSRVTGAGDVNEFDVAKRKKTFAFVAPFSFSLDCFAVFWRSHTCLWPFAVPPDRDGFPVVAKIKGCTPFELRSLFAER